MNNSSKLSSFSISILQMILTYLPGTASSRTCSGLITVPFSSVIHIPFFNFAKIGPGSDRIEMERIKKYVKNMMISILSECVKYQFLTFGVILKASFTK